MKAYKRLLEDGLFAFRKIISTRPFLFNCYFPSLNVFVCAILGSIFEHFLLSYQWSQPGGVSFVETIVA